MADEIAIRVEGVSKDFKLPLDRHNSFKSKMVHAFGKTKGYQTQHALKDISFEVKKGEFFGIVGRNGSGKSTMLKILASIYQPTKGKISVAGKLVPFIELGVGFNPELTGRENVFLNGALLGFSNEEVAKMYDEIVEFAELEKFMDQKLKNYSSGMQVRLAFSMAVRADADILLIDEVLAVGDADFQRKCYDYFRKLKRDEKTVVFVSHDMGAVREFCDRAVLINDSELKEIGDTGTIASSYQALFMGEVDGEPDSTFNTKKRVGTGVVVVDSAKLNKATYTNKDDTLVLRVDLKVGGGYEDLLSGIAIKNSQGQYISSVHTGEYKIALPRVPRGRRIKLEWAIPNIYEDGRYSVDVFINEASEVYDRIDDALEFTVKRPDHTGALVAVEEKVRLL